MNATFKNIVAGLITAAIVANVGVLWQFNSRLASIETTLKFLSETKNTTIAIK